MLIPILIALVLIVVVLVIIVALQPADFCITRSATINATPEKVFPMVNDFHRWDDWSPWAKIDPAMKSTYSGSPAGEGAIYEWSGNNKVGQGRMTLLQSKPHEYVHIRLEFMKPFQATNKTEFILKPEGNTTHLTWKMSGKNNFMAKAFALIMNMDKLVGKDFEKGLSQLNRLFN